jgi:dihydrofolate synthase/folylpolyglutamate synthase
MKTFNATAYLNGLNIDVMRFGLDAITDALSRLGNPQNDYPTILIAGTNGKGSTSAMTASILTRAGYRTGLYTSPHLLDIRERVVIGGKMIPLARFNRIIGDIRDVIRKPLTYFEILTAAAFVYFREQKVNVAVLEVGLGGRLDATNVCDPLVSVITNISLEHTAWLGKTLDAIAREKAGIIKKNGVCITAAAQRKVRDVFASVCESQKSDLYCLGRDIRIRKQSDGRVSYLGLFRSIDGLNIGLPGDHQRVNAALAIAAVEIAARKGLPVDDEAIRQGLCEIRWAARGEVLMEAPVFLLDGAHNPAGIQTLCRSLKNDFSYRRLILIFASLSDKNYSRMLRQLAPLADRIYLPRLGTQRAVPPERLARELRRMNIAALETQTVHEALQKALATAKKQDMICAAGSIYLAGEIKQSFSQSASYGKCVGGKKVRGSKFQV